MNYVPNTKKSGDTHISWRINRMAPARLIRTLFPKPFIVSERAGQSMERYVMIDEPFTKGYSLPNLECSYVFVIQAFGERTIILRPSRECGSACRTVSVVLKPSYVCKFIFSLIAVLLLTIKQYSSVVQLVVLEAYQLSKRKQH